MVAKALELPLYRQEITGQPNNTEMSYKESEGDEVEDLYRLLRRVKERHPEVEGEF
jgi:diphthine-ammonia ligase